MADDPTPTPPDPAPETHMIDVGAKPITRRRALAEARVAVGRAVAARIERDGGLAKGNVLETARLAGIMAAKRTASLIPLCHPLPLDAVEVRADLEADGVRIRAEVRAEARTGVEMEALTAAAVAALTVYDMVKAAARGARIESVRLLEKDGGASGRWRCQEHTDAAD